MSKPSDIYGRPWSEREYIIVLHFYVVHRNAPRHERSPYVVQLAELLGRTTAAVLMRLENYSGLDPNSNRRGLRNVGPVGERVFHDWFEKPDVLKACAEVLLREAHVAAQPTLFDPEPVRLPKAFGKYELLDQIGDGGFGEVFSCLNSEDGCSYALKIIRTDCLADKELVSRFRREIKALKSIHHPNIIRIHEDNLEETPSFPGFVMDLAKCSLTTHLEERLANAVRDGNRPLLPHAESAEIMQAVFDGVEALHQHDPVVIHRDIKPCNILCLATGSWALADFSLTKFLPRAIVTTTFATASRQAWGTHGYSAPEQFQDFKLADERADIYSLGVLIWELFSPLWPPFDRTCTQLPAPLESVVVKATQRDKAKRHSSVGEIRKEFLEALQKDGDRRQ